ncbi:MAG: thioredoxin family protein [Kiritimatiellae bacterium]|nr:thioredoxin family protein [Kiritimatiellia bacterium]
MQKILLSIVLAAAFSANLRGADNWLTDFEAAKKTAAERQLPILADFSGSDWCGWCIRLDKEVFSRKEFQEFAKDRLVLFLADFPRNKPQDDAIKKQNAALSKQYGVRGFPTVLLLDAKGKVLARTGYIPGGPGAYVEHLKKLIP